MAIATGFSSESIRPGRGGGWGASPNFRRPAGAIVLLCRAGGCQHWLISVGPLGQKAVANSYTELNALHRTDANRLFHVAFEHGEQFPQLALAILGIGGLRDALMGVLMNNDLGKRLEGLAGRDNLGQHLGTIAVLPHHFFDGVELADDFPKPDLQGLPLIRVMAVVMLRCHTDQSGPELTARKDFYL